MNRRTALVGTGTVLSGVLAGCLGRLESGFTCFQGRPVVVLEPTDASREEEPHSRAVIFAGPNNSQPRIAAGEIAAELGIDERVQALEYGESVHLQWIVQDERFLLGFIGGEGR